MWVDGFFLFFWEARGGEGGVLVIVLSLFPRRSHFFYFFFLPLIYLSCPLQGAGCVFPPSIITDGATALHRSVLIFFVSVLTALSVGVTARLWSFSFIYFSSFISFFFFPFLSESGFFCLRV